MLFFAVIGLLFGIFFSSHLSVSYLYYPILFLLSVFCWRWRLYAVLIFFILLGLALGEYSIWRYRPPYFLFPFDNKVMLLDGELVGVPKVLEKGGLQFDIKSQSTKIRVFWNKPTFELVPGDLLRFEAKIRKPSAYVNPGFDERKRWVSSKIAATATVIHGIERLGHHTTIDTLRYQLQQKASQFSQKLPYLGVSEALVLGVSQNISAQTLRLFQNTGTSHLMAISGLHVGLVAGFFIWVAKGLLRFRSYRYIQQPTQLLALLLGGVGATVYACLAGFSLPTQRALIMIGVLILMTCLRIKTSVWVSLLLAMLLILLCDPLAVMSPGFWLSCMAVACLLYSRGQSWWGGTIHFIIRFNPFYFVVFSQYQPDFAH